MSIATGDDRRIRQMIELAAQAEAAGRSQEAERLLRQAQVESPRHPLVLNEAARRMLQGGNPAGAYVLLEEAVKGDSTHPSLWLNLAAALRGLHRVAEEKAALERVLAIEPRHVGALLNKASLQEQQGETRAAAATYRAALESLPPMGEMPAAMYPVLQHARKVVETNNRALEDFLEQRMRNLRERHAGERLERFDRCLATLLQKRRNYRQHPKFLFFPELPAIEFHERGDFPWLDSIEAATDEIRAELLNVLDAGPSTLEPYVAVPQGVTLDWAELNHSRRWGVYSLWREGVAVSEHLARCPRTVAALEPWPRWDVPRCGPTAMFSILDARTHIPAHNGTDNTRLVVHLPLVVPPGCRFRVGAEYCEWHPGQAFVFDDTIEHEAWNDSEAPRAVLILDIWNPLLTMTERELVRAVVDGVGEYYGTSPLAEAAK